MMRGYVRRFALLTGGVIISAVSITMILQANVGLDPWSVLQSGMAKSFGISYGVASIIVGAAAIGIAVFFGESFGVGTLANTVICGLLVDGLLYLGWIPQMTEFWPGIAMLLAGLEVLSIGTWMYLKSAMGAGPRDALMVVLARKTRRSVGLCRAAVEILVILLGWWLGGQVGIGTVISAVGLGSLFNLNFALLRFDAAQVKQENLIETLRALRGKARTKQ